MYEAYFGLRERPFSKTPDPRFLFLSRGHREALARMQYAVEERDLVLLTGEIGCGKTLTRTVLHRQLKAGANHIVTLENGYEEEVGEGDGLLDVRSRCDHGRQRHRLGR